MRQLSEHAHPLPTLPPQPSILGQWASEDLFSLEQRGLRRTLEPLSSRQGPVVRVGDETLVNFTSNDYLSLAGDPRLAQALAEAAERHGVGSGASRLLVGDSLAHHALEERLASFVGAEAALVFNSGYAANVGAVSSFCGPGDVIFSDALNHASLVDGCRLSRAQVVVYPHRDMAALDALLRENPGRRRMVCTEAVFSMDGDRAPLRELVALCRLRGAALMVDEAHALGVLGAHGAGLCEELGISADVDVRMGTLGKALGTFGAFVAGSRAAVELMANRARSFVFSTALPGALCVASMRALALVQSEPALRERLWRNVRHFAAGLRQLGLPSSESRSAIFPLVLGEPEAALAAARRLRERGVLAKAIRPPTVPPGTSRIRFAISAGHGEADLDRCLGALSGLSSSHGC